MKRREQNEPNLRQNSKAHSPSYRFRLLIRSDLSQSRVVRALSPPLLDLCVSTFGEELAISLVSGPVGVLMLRVGRRRRSGRWSGEVRER